MWETRLLEEEARVGEGTSRWSMWKEGSISDSAEYLDDRTGCIFCPFSIREPAFRRESEAALEVTGVLLVAAGVMDEDMEGALTGMVENKSGLDLREKKNVKSKKEIRKEKKRKEKKSRKLGEGEHTKFSSSVVRKDEDAEN